MTAFQDFVHKELGRPGTVPGYDLEAAQTLSHAGWVYNPASNRWDKDGHGISVEGFDEMLRNFHAIRPRFLKAICEGALGFTFDVEANDQWANAEGKDWEFRVSVCVTWPDAVTRLGKIV